METLFRIMVEQIAEPAPKPCPWPMFLAAYWPKDSRWKVMPEMFEVESPGMNQEIKRLERAGWTHITVMRLPEELWRVEP